MPSATAENLRLTAAEYLQGKANAFFYPDVVVTCHPQDRDSRLFKQHPVFIAEVLSPSTEAFDRG